VALVKSSDKVVYYRIDSMKSVGVMLACARGIWHLGFALTKSTKEGKRRARERRVLYIFFCARTSSAGR